MRNKRKGILMASAILGSAAIVSTGFAAWVITVEDTEVATGNIEVDKVEDNSHVITVNGTPDLTVAFGYKADADVTNPWLTYSATNSDSTAGVTEDFTTSYSFTVTNPSSCDFETVAITYTGTENAKTAFQSAITNKYIATPTVSLDFNDDTGVGSLIFTFGWGDYFKVGTENVNPYVFFNSKTATDLVGGDGANKNNTWAAEAVAVLGAIEDAKGVGFQVTLQTKAKASS